MSLRRLVLPASLLAFAACNNGSTASALVRLDPEAAGANCPHGGIRVSTGLDKNDDAALGDDEVTASRYVCNGADGASGDAGVNGLNALSVITAEPAGANCQYGGVRVDVGVDQDGDGTLAPAEITSTRYLCDQASVDGIWFGNITISTGADLAALSGIQHITGDLLIDAVDGGALSLPELKSVGGFISWASQGEGTSAGVEALQSVSFPALEQAGTIDLWYAPALTTLSLPKLARVDQLTVFGHDALTSLDLSALARADIVRIEWNPLLPALALPELAYLNQLSISSNDVLATLTAPKLAFLRDSLVVSSNPLLPECSAWRLRAGLTSSINPYTYIDSNDTTATCTAADLCASVAVTGVGGSLRACVRPMSFTDAETLCESIGAGSALAWVTSDAEWQALSAAAASGAVRPGWLGYSDTTTEGAWVAVGGFTGYDPTARMDFWSAGEPNGGTAENGAELFDTGLVADSAVTLTRPFLCRSP